MLVATTWSLVVVLVALFSLGLWLLHAFSVWSLSSAGALAGASPTLASSGLPDWLAVWVPAEWLDMLRSGIEALGPWVSAALAALPALAQWLTPLAWLVWGLGVLVLLAGGGVVHLLARMAGRASTA